MIQLSRSNPILLPYNQAFHKNCNGEPKELWAWRNGTHICNIQMNGCLSFKPEKNYIYLHLTTYDPTSSSQHWKIDKSGGIMESSQSMCLFEQSPIVNGKDYAETPMLLGANRACISWSFVPSLDNNNQHVCADFKEKTPSMLS